MDTNEYSPVNLDPESRAKVVRLGKIILELIQEEVGVIRNRSE